MKNQSIIVVQPPLRVSRDFIDYPYHSDLGVVQAAAVLAEQSMAVRVVDAYAMAGSTLSALDDNYVLMGAPISAVVDAIGDAGLIVVRYTPFHRPPHSDPILRELLDALRLQTPEVPIVLADLYQSGEHYVDRPGNEILGAYPQVDGFIKYQAESVLTAVCERLLSDGRPDTPFVELGPAVADLDALPLPAWELVDLEARDAFMADVVANLGRGGWAFPINGRTLPAVSSRGCPYRCAHCSSNPSRLPDMPKRQYRLSEQRLGELVRGLVQDHRATRIDFLDEMVNVETTHFDALLAHLDAHGVAYDFPNGMRADWVTKEQLATMVGRISTLSVSAESGVQRVVDEVVGKKLDLTRVEATVAEASRLKIPTLVHFIIGMPGETKADINGTLEYALKLHSQYNAWPAVQFATPLPGTRLATTALEAAGGTLPEVADFGFFFQHKPVTRDVDFTPADLQAFKWTFDQRMGINHGPQKVIMNVTYRCNNRCNFCAVGNRKQLDGNFGYQKKVLLEYRKLGLHSVDFDGGEPTLYENLTTLIRYCRKIGYSAINVTTNGRMCVYPDYAKRLVRSGLSTLLFSVHGADAETHAKNVGVPEAFEQTTEGIRQCVAFAPRGVDLGMNITLTKSNYEQLPAVTQLAWDLGLRWLNIQFLTPFGRATSRVNPDTHAAADTTMKVIGEWRDKMKFQVINLPFCFMPGYEEFILGDLLKIQRHMVFVNNSDVNLYDYLKERRSYAPECESCPRKVFCGGFYDLDECTEPPWEFDIMDPDEVLRLADADSTYQR
ncbi:MAG TPA: radical SAM protein [Myxococcales bacterium]|nr:radical SAM protein [Myxococcales bacterium]